MHEIRDQLARCITGNVDQLLADYLAGAGEPSEFPRVRALLLKAAWSGAYEAAAVLSYGPTYIRDECRGEVKRG